MAIGGAATGRAGRAVALIAAAGALAACSTSGQATRQASPTSAPPRPPAACLLDTAKLRTDTGLSWTPDASTASDVRCVYDPAADDGTRGPGFVTVILAQRAAPDAATELDTLGELCDKGSRAPVVAADGAFVCRFASGTVFAATVRGTQVLTLSASSVPEGTTTAKVVLGLGRQLAGTTG